MVYVHLIIGLTEIRPKGVLYSSILWKSEQIKETP
jgi:hypothetical protein